MFSACKSGVVNFQAKAQLSGGKWRLFAHNCCHYLDWIWGISILTRSCSKTTVCGQSFHTGAKKTTAWQKSLFVFLLVGLSMNMPAVKKNDSVETYIQNYSLSHSSRCRLVFQYSLVSPHSNDILKKGRSMISLSLKKTPNGVKSISWLMEVLWNLASQSSCYWISSVPTLHLRCNKQV